MNSIPPRTGLESNMPQKRSLTTGEIAEYCGVSFRTVIRWIERGQLRAYQLPGRGDNRVEVGSFLDFLKANKMPVPREFGGFLRRVLIVEDEPSMARAIQRVLKRSGYETLIAQNGFRAGTLVGIFSPAVITLDLKMPGIAGMDVIKFLKASEKFRSIRILVVSAMPRKEVQKALGMGADDILEKPFENEMLVKKVGQLF